MDDFGAGNSSLATCAGCRVTRVKIDRSLVSRMRFRPDDAAIVDSTILLAHALGLKVIAEGVETEGCAAYLAEVGCELAQGFLFGPGDVLRRHRRGGPCLESPIIEQCRSIMWR